MHQPSSVCSPPLMNYVCVFDPGLCKLGLFYSSLVEHVPTNRLSIEFQMSWSISVGMAIVSSHKPLLNPLHGSNLYSTDASRHAECS